MAHHKPATGHPLPQSSAPAGYPGGAIYCAVPPPSYYHQSTALYNSQPPRRPFMPAFLCQFLGCVAAVFTFFALLSFITLLVLKPRLPEFRVVSASVASLNTTTTGSSSYLTAQWNITLIATNPNHKLFLYYSEVAVGVFYGGNDLLASTRYPPLLQGTESETRVDVRLAAVDEFVKEGVAKGISGERAGGFVGFGVKLSSWVRFKYGIVGSRYHLLEAVCYPLIFDFSPNNATLGTLHRALICGVNGCRNCFHI